MPTFQLKIILDVFLLLVILFFVVASLYISGTDNEQFFNSFFYIAIGFVVAEGIVIDFFTSVFCDVLVPNLIYDAVLYLRGICQEHIENLCSHRRKLDYYCNFSSTRYLHASNFFAKSLQDSVEKAFVIAYVDPLPSRTGTTWCNKHIQTSSIIGRLVIEVFSRIPPSVLYLITSLIICLLINALLLYLSVVAGAVPTYATIGSLVLVILSTARGGTRDSSDEGKNIDFKRVHPQPPTPPTSIDMQHSDDANEVFISPATKTFNGADRNVELV